MSIFRNDRGLCVLNSNFSLMIEATPDRQQAITVGRVDKWVNIKNRFFDLRSIFKLS